MSHRRLQPGNPSRREFLESMKTPFWYRWIFLLVLAVLGVSAASLLQASPTKDKDRQNAEKSDKQEKKRQKAIQKELESPDTKWLDEEVPYIMTSDGRWAARRRGTEDATEDL